MPWYFSEELMKKLKLKLTVCRYEVKFQNGQECGGAYLKLLTAADNLDLVSYMF